MMSEDQATAPGRAPRTAVANTLCNGPKHLRYPIPIDWLAAAARLPGRSLHVGVALWVAYGVVNSRVVPLPNVSGLRFGLDRNAKYRGLAWLEQAGLVTVQRKLGRAPMVTILDGGGGHER